MSKEIDIMVEFFKIFIQRSNNPLKKGGTRYQYTQQLKYTASRPTIDIFIDKLISFKVLFFDKKDKDKFFINEKNFFIFIDDNKLINDIVKMDEYRCYVKIK